MGRSRTANTSGERPTVIHEGKKIVMPLSLIATIITFVGFVGYNWKDFKPLPAKVKALETQMAQTNRTLAAHCRVIKKDSRFFVIVCDRKTGAFIDVDFRYRAMGRRSQLPAVLKRGKNAQ